MKKVITISSAVVGGAVSRGLTGMVEASTPVKIGVNLGMAVFGGWLAYSTKGTSTKDAIIGGAGLGVAVAQGLEAVKNIFKTDSLNKKLNPETKTGRFLQRMAGLSGADGGLNGYFDQAGNYHEDGLGGYIDTEGNFVQTQGLNAYNDEGLYGAEDEGLYASEDEGLYAYEDEEGLYAYEDEGLYASEEEGLYAYEEEY